VLKGEAQFDLVLRYQKQYRDTKEAIENVRLLSPSGERVSLAQLTTRSPPTTAPKKIYREGEQRYIAIKYSVRDRDLGSPSKKPSPRSTSRSSCPRAITIEWAGEYRASSAPTSAWP
jgi:heavy metal efflux system protein